MPAVQYALECVAQAAHARIAVNDVPVFLHHGDDSSGATVPINRWLADEPTELRIEMAGVQADGALAGVLRVTLVARTAGEVERELLDIVLPRDARDVVVEGRQWQLEHVVKVPGLVPPPSEFWPVARSLRLSDEDRATIHELVLDYQRTLDVLDNKALDAALKFQLADTARAYHVKELDMRAALAFAIHSAVGTEEIDPHADEGIADLEASMQLHLVGRDRLVWVTRANYADALRIPSVNPTVTLPIYLAPLHGRWTIVR
ncbi:MAG TPA: hypothetical protein VFB62_18415 [Polyangiaceae bacterium]|jgi:hypothetical protein|nr:hypothetical protein [Polyangiaceae bacterium]